MYRQKIQQSMVMFTNFFFWYQEIIMDASKYEMQKNEGIVTHCFLKTMQLFGQKLWLTINILLLSHEIYY